MSTRAITVGLVLLLLVAPLVGVVGGAATGATTSSAPESQEYGTSIENVSIWERSVIPFRANQSAADETVDLNTLFINTPSGEQVRMNRDQIRVYSADTAVPLELEEKETAQTSTYNGTPVRVIVGKLEPSMTAESLGGLSMLESNLSSLNANVTFENESKTKITNAGSLANSVEYTPNSSGQYVALVATIDSGNGLTVANGNLSPDGNATIVGLESFLVRDGASTATPTDSDLDSEDLGANVTFDVTTSITPGAAGSVEHGLVLYNEDAFLDTNTTVNVTSPGANLTAEDISVEPGISDLNGVWRLEGDATVTDAINEIRNATGSEGIVLDASATTNTTTQNATIEVGTQTDWNADATYRYIHVAGNETGDQLQTTTGTLSFEDEQPGGGGPIIGPGPSPPDDKPKKGDKPMPIITIDPETPSVGDPITFSGAESTDSKWEIIGYEWTINGQQYTGESVTTRFYEPGDYTVELTVRNQINVTNTVTETVTVTKDTKPGDGTGTDDPDGTDGPDDTDGTSGGDGDGGDDGLLPVPGFGPAVTLVALLSVVLLLARKQD